MQEIKEPIVIIQTTLLDQKQIILANEKFEIQEIKMADTKSLINCIYIGIVENINFALEVAFVRFARDKVGFLAFKHINSNYFQEDSLRLKKNSKVLVQVFKDAHENKTENLTTFITLSGNSSILLPYSNESSGVSSNIRGEIRNTFRSLVEHYHPYSVIIRTNALEFSVDQVQTDIENLVNIFKELEREFKLGQKYGPLLRFDNFWKNFISYFPLAKKILFLDQATLLETTKLAQQFNLSHANFEKITKSDDIRFIKSQLEALKDLIVKLPSGGTVFFQKTEACFSIDINSGKSFQEKNLEDTVFNTNLEAAHLIAQQIILRNLYGIIMIDFIDMKDEENVITINSIIKSYFRKDKSAIKIVEINKLGVMQISRQKLNISHFDQNFQKCQRCLGRGHVLKDEVKAMQLIEDILSYPKSAPLNVSACSEILTILLNHSQKFKQHTDLHFQISDVNEVIRANTQ
jgi:ribonuclease E